MIVTEISEQLILLLCTGVTNFAVSYYSLAYNCKLIAERISARQYKSGSILGITYVRSSAQAHTSRRSLRRRRRLDVYARARIQYRLGACETRFIAFATLNATLGSSRSFLDRFSTPGEILHVYMYTCTHAYVEFHVYVYACTHA